MKKPSPGLDRRGKGKNIIALNPTEPTRGNKSWLSKGLARRKGLARNPSSDRLIKFNVHADFDDACALNIETEVENIADFMLLIRLDIDFLHLPQSILI